MVPTVHASRSKRSSHIRRKTELAYVCEEDAESTKKLLGSACETGLSSIMSKVPTPASTRFLATCNLAKNLDLIQGFALMQSDLCHVTRCVAYGLPTLVTQIACIKWSSTERPRCLHVCTLALRHTTVALRQLRFCKN